jgi:arylsulfatase A-like enzyme
VLRLASETHRATVVLLLFACCSAGCDEPVATAPAVLLVTFDTTRADRIGAYGHSAARTPHWDALARRGLQFQRAYSPTPLTLPAHTSMLTGTWPSAHGVRDNTLFSVAPESRMVSEALSERGWRTAAFVGAFVLDARYGLDQGFEVYAGPAQSSAESATIAERPAVEVTDAALEWLAGVALDESFFLWVHYFDPHHPYAPPAPFGESLADAYDAEIAYADSEMGRLLEALGNQGRLDETLVIATSDHGESLGEHGEQSHGFFLYESAVRVPLVVAGPRIEHALVPAAVSLIDVTPTVLEWCGAPRLSMRAALGPSLLSTAARWTDADADGAGVDDRALYLETFLPFYAQAWAPQQALIWRGHKLIQTRRPELYDLQADPTEAHDLTAAEPELAAAMLTRLTELIAAHPPLGISRVDPLRQRDLAALAELGYTGGKLGDNPFDQNLPDAKDGIADIVKEGTALFDLREGRRLLELPAQERDAHMRLERAQRLYSELLESYPARTDFLSQLALAEASLGLTEQAADNCERLILSQPTVASHRLQLARAYEALGRKDWALAEMQKAVALDRRTGPAFEWLCAHHESLGELGRAAFWRAEQERFLLGNDELKRFVRTEAQRLASRARELDQEIAGPREYPRPDLAPERLAQP